jgi:hypothetical protein
VELGEIFNKKRLERRFIETGSGLVEVEPYRDLDTFLGRGSLKGVR